MTLEGETETTRDKLHYVMSDSTETKCDYEIQRIVVQV